MVTSQLATRLAHEPGASGDLPGSTSRRWFNAER